MQENWARVAVDRKSMGLSLLARSALALLAVGSACAREGAMVELKLEGAIGKTVKAQTEQGLRLGSSETLFDLIEGDGLYLMVDSARLPHMGPLIIDELKLQSETVDASALVLFVNKLTLPTAIERGIEIDGVIDGKVKNTAGDSTASGTFWIAGDCDPAYRSMCAAGASMPDGRTTMQLIQTQPPVGCQLALQDAFFDTDPGNVEITYDPDANKLALKGGNSIQCLKSSAADGTASSILCSDTREVSFEGCTYSTTIWGHLTFIGISAVGVGAGCDRKDCTISYWEP